MFDNIENEVNTNSGNGGKFELYEGPIMFRPVLICPNREKLNNFLGSTKNTEELSYHSQSTSQKTGETVDQVRIDFWGYYTKPDGTEFKGKLESLWVKNKVLSSEKTPGVVKFNYINSCGQTSFSTEELQFPDWFYNGNVRKCLEGEELLMHFMVKLMGVNTFIKNTEKELVSENIKNGNYYINCEALFNGDFSIIQSVLDKYCSDECALPKEHVLYKRKIGVLATLRVRTDTQKVSQSNYTKVFAAVNYKNLNYTIKQTEAKWMIDKCKQDVNNNYFSTVGVIKETLGVYSEQPVSQTPAPEIAW